MKNILSAFQTVVFVSTYIFSVAAKHSWIGQPSTDSDTPYTHPLDHATKIISEHPEDPVFIQKCKELGCTDMNLVYPYRWDLGDAADRPDYKKRRLAQLNVYAQKFPDDNLFERPLSWEAVFHITAKKIVEFYNLYCGDDFSTDVTNVTIPEATLNYGQNDISSESLRKYFKPVEISSPHGFNFKITWHKLEWQKWQMHIGLSSREGLVVNHAGYNDNGKYRPLHVHLRMNGSLWRSSVTIPKESYSSH